MKGITSATCAFRNVKGPDDPDRDDFARLYEQVASTRDFVWVYRGDDIVREFWVGNAGHFIQTARGPDGRMVGYVCCHPLALDVEPRVQQWVRGHELPFPAEEAVIISSIGVHPSARKGGIAMSLGYDALRWAMVRGFSRFVLQASVEVARKPAGLAERLGARTVAKLQGAREDKNHVVLLYGSVRDALAGDECNH